LLRAARAAFSRSATSPLPAESSCCDDTDWAGESSAFFSSLPRRIALSRSPRSIPPAEPPIDAVIAIGALGGGGGPPGGGGAGGGGGPPEENAGGGGGGSFLVGGPRGGVGTGLSLNDGRSLYDGITGGDGTGLLSNAAGLSGGGGARIGADSGCNGAVNLDGAGGGIFTSSESFLRRDGGGGGGARELLLAGGGGGCLLATVGPGPGLLGASPGTIPALSVMNL